MKKPLFSKPLGPSKLGGFADGSWGTRGNTCHIVICEVCGTEHPALEEGKIGRSISVIMDYQVVDECCGAIIDHVYGEVREEFAVAFIGEFKKSPADSQFGFLRHVLKGAMQEAAKKMAETTAEVAEISAAAEKL